MKKFLKIFFSIAILCSPVLVTAQAPGFKLISSPVLKLKSAQDSVQYALGAYLAQWALNNGFTVTDAQAFLTGMEDVFKNKPRLVTDNFVTPFLTAYQKNNESKKAKAQEEQLFALIKDKPGIGKLPSGVQYSVLKPGKGPRPAETDSVIINFKGTLADGTVFEDTYAKNLRITTTPSILIPGLLETIQLMPLGAAWEIYIPAALAYADKGNPPLIPPNSALIIVIELLEIKGKKG